MSLPITALVLCLTLPLLGAIATVAAPRHATPLVTSVAGLMVAVTTGLTSHVAVHGPVVVALGEWAPPLGIQIMADGPAVLFLLVNALVMAAVVLFSLAPIGQPGPRSRLAQTFWPLLLLLWGALNAIFVSRDLFNLYVGLELASLAAVALVAIERKRDTLNAALRYLLFALTGSLLYLLGVVLIYAGHGTLDITLLAGELGMHPTDALAIGAMTAGLAAKTALFPFHVWLPPAHAGAPAPASAVLSALVPKASLYIALRLWLEAAPGAGDAIAVNVLGWLGALAVVHGSIMALRQERLKLVIAYSTVAQIGYLFLVFPLALGAAGAVGSGVADSAWNGTLFQALSHALAKAALFLCAGLILEAAGHDRIARLAGVAQALPVTLFAFGLAAITLMGLPPSGGFMAKYLLVTASLEGGVPGWGLVVLAGGLLAAAYLYRPMASAFRHPDQESAAPFTPVAAWRQAIPLGLAIASLALGILPAVPHELMGGMP